MGGAYTYCSNMEWAPFQGLSAIFRNASLILLSVIFLLVKSNASSFLSDTSLVVGDKRCKQLSQFPSQPLQKKSSPVIVSDVPLTMEMERVESFVQFASDLKPIRAGGLEYQIVEISSSQLMGTFAPI